MELQMAAMKQRQERMEARVEALERDKARLEARVDELEHTRVESAPMLAPEQDEPKPLLAFGYIEVIELLAHICSFLASKDLGRLVCVSASFGRKTDWQRSEEGGGTQQLSVMEEVARRWVAARPAEEQAWAPDGSWLQRMHVIQRHDGLVQEGLRCWLDAAHYGSVDAAMITACGAGRTDRATAFTQFLWMASMARMMATRRISLPRPRSTACLR